MSLVLSSGLAAVVSKEGFVDKESDAYLERYTTLAIQCSFLVGLVYLIMGYCRMGFVTQFLSRPLISGFTSGAAIIIAVSQIKYIFGYSIPGFESLARAGEKSYPEHRSIQLEDLCHGNLWNCHRVGVQKDRS